MVAASEGRKGYPPGSALPRYVRGSRGYFVPVVEGPGGGVGGGGGGYYPPGGGGRGGGGGGSARAGGETSPYGTNYSGNLAQGYGRQAPRWLYSLMTSWRF
jgi:hypothetical protein